MTMLPKPTDVVVLRLLRQALRILTDRLLTILVFMAACAAAGYTLLDPNWHRDAITVFFGILYLATLNRERANRHEETQGTPTEVETG